MCGNAEEGRGLFLSNCSVCHGPGASGTYLPNLRNSPMIVTADNFKSVVLDGARRQNGMVSFAKYLTPAQVESIRAYLLQQARAYQAAGGRVIFGMDCVTQAGADPGLPLRMRGHAGERAHGREQPGT